MASYRRTRAPSAARRARTTRSRSGTYRRANSGRRTTRRSTARRAATPRAARIVVEVVQPGAVRSGEPVGIGDKVAPMPRLKPRF